LDSGIGSLEWIPGLLKRLQIRAQATLASGISSLELIPGLLKHLQIRAQATLDSGIGSLELIPGLLKHLLIQAQATLNSGIVSFEERRRRQFFFIKTNIFVPQRRIMNFFVPKLSKERSQTKVFVPQLSQE